MLFYCVTVYLRFHQYYGKTVGQKLSDLAWTGLATMVACAIVGLAMVARRGAARTARPAR